MSLDALADELYALPPEEFTATRNARAKEARAAGDADLAVAVQALRKPTVAAWLLNQFVRRHRDEVEQVLDLGARLREAQETVGAGALAELNRQRRQLTHAVAQQVRAVGLHERRSVSDQVLAAVEETLRSAMVDEAAGNALSTGLLTDTFSSTGIDPVDLSRVVALPGAVEPAVTGEPRPEPDAVPAVDEEQRRRREDAQRAADEADSALGAAREAVELAEGTASTAAGEHEQLVAQRDDLRRRLDDVERRVGKAAKALEDAGRARELAHEAVAAATAEAKRLHEELEGLPG